MTNAAKDKLAFTVNETSVRTGLGRDGVYEAIREGKLLARKYGRRTLILQSDLDRFLATLPALTLD
jgi:excisionase family DNA binding protein